MTTLHNLDSLVLLSRAKELLHEERRVTVQFIEHLEEIDSRMLYAEMGYSSLWDFSVKELGLSEGAAQRRIQAMRLSRKVPEIKGAIVAGSITLSNAARLQSFYRAEKKSGRSHDLHKLVEMIVGKTQQECERLLFEVSPQASKAESDRLASAQNDRELKFTVSAEVYEKLQRLKGLLAHAKPDATYAELTEFMVTDVLHRLEKRRGIKRKSDDRLAVHEFQGNGSIASESNKSVKCESSESSESNDARIPSTAAATVFESTTASEISLTSVCVTGQRIYLPALVRKRIWARSGGRCEFVSDIQSKRCNSTFRLEIDHVLPLALGGTNRIENLRLICWHHNHQQALVKLGNVYRRRIENQSRLK